MVTKLRSTNRIPVPAKGMTNTNLGSICWKSMRYSSSQQPNDTRYYTWENKNAAIEYINGKTRHDNSNVYFHNWRSHIMLKVNNSEEITTQLMNLPTSWIWLTFEPSKLCKIPTTLFPTPHQSHPQKGKEKDCTPVLLR